MSNFICPCCGFHVVYSEEFSNSTYDLICSYYGVATTNSSWRAKIMTVYFLKKMTGAPFKVVCGFLKISQGHGTKMISNAIAYIDKRTEHAREAKEIEQMIIVRQKSKAYGN